MVKHQEVCEIREAVKDIIVFNKFFLQLEIQKVVSTNLRQTVLGDE